MLFTNIYYISHPQKTILAGGILPREHRGSRRFSWILWGSRSDRDSSGDKSMIGPSLPSPASSPASSSASSLLSLKVLSTQPHINAKLQYYGAAKTTSSNKAGALPTGQVGNDLITRCITLRLNSIGYVSCICIIILVVMVSHRYSWQVPHPLRASVEHRPEGVSIDNSLAWASSKRR